MTWNRLKSELATRFPGRPTLIVHYGDHQPVMTRRIEAKLKLPTDARRQFRTFYAMETLNYCPDRLVSGRGTRPGYCFSRDSRIAAGRSAA